MRFAIVVQNLSFLQAQASCNISDDFIESYMSFWSLMFFQLQRYEKALNKNW